LSEEELAVLKYENELLDNGLKEYGYTYQGTDPI